jgi:hypothetical protein
MICVVEEKRKIEMARIMQVKLGTEITVGDRIFNIGKMDAASALAVLKELLSQSLPTDLFAQAGFSGISGLLSGNQQDTEMSIEAFTILVHKLLFCVSEKLAGGYTKVIRQEDLAFQVADLEFDIELTVELVGHVIKENYASFFISFLKKLGLMKEGETLEDLAEKTKGFAASFKAQA